MHADRVLLCRVSPFGNLRIDAYVPLPVAYRSLSRPSSAPDAKAFPLRPCLLDHVGGSSLLSASAIPLRGFAKAPFRSLPPPLPSHTRLRWAVSRGYGRGTGETGALNSPTTVNSLR